MANYRFKFGWAEKPSWGRSNRGYVPTSERSDYDESLVEVIPSVEEYRPGFGRLQGKKRRNARGKIS